MTKRVVGEEIHEDGATRVHSREAADKELEQITRRRDRTVKNIARLTEELAGFNADIAEWDTAIAALPPLPEPEPEPA